MPDLADLFRGFDLVGVTANAILAGVIAREERLDPVGYITLAVLTALGGGALRDVLLQHGPPAALTDRWYLICALAGAALSFLIRVRSLGWDRVWPVLDALALGTWAAAGAAKTASLGFSWVAAVLLGMVTAVGGGMIRDVVLNRRPGVLGGNTLYATCAIAAAATQVLFGKLGQPTWGLVAGTLVGFSMCLIARWRGWILPDADAWAPAYAIPLAYRRRVRRRAARQHPSAGVTPPPSRAHRHVPRS